MMRVMESLTRLLRHGPRSLVACALLTLALASSRSLAGRGAGDSLYHQEWRWARFDEQSGLPSAHVFDVVESTAGTQWVLTSKGIAWYDGFLWQGVALPQTATIEPPAQIVADSKDRIVVTTGGSVYRGNQHGMVRLFPTETGQQNTEVTSAVPVDGDRVLLHSSLRTISLWENGKATRLGISDTLESAWDNSKTMYRLRDASVWLPTASGAYAWNGRDLELRIRRPTRFLQIDDSGAILAGAPRSSSQSMWVWPEETAVEVPEEAHGWNLRAVDVAPNGDAIVVYHTGEMRVRSDGVWAWLTPLPWELVDVTFVRFKRNGDLWAGTNHGLFLCRRSLSRWERRDFDRSHINALLRASTGDLWIAHSHGLAIHHADGTEDELSSIGDISLRITTGLAEDAEGAIWISSGGAFTGVFRLRDGQWQRYGPPDGLPEARFHKIAKDRRGRLWFLGHAPEMPPTRDHPDPGAYVHDDGEFVRWGVPEGLLHGRVYAFVEGIDGSYWFGTLGGLSRWKAGQWTHWRRHEGLRDNKIFTLAVGPDGRIWFGHQHAVGLGYIDEQEHPVYVDSAEHLGHAGIWDLQFAPDGALWIATDRGLGRYHDGMSSLFDSSVGARGLYLWPLLPEEGEIYAGTQGDGLHVLDLSEARNPPPRVTIHPAVFSGSDTLVKWTVHPFQAEQPCSKVGTRFRVDGGAWSQWSRTHAAVLPELKHGDHTLAVQAKSLFGKVDPEGTRLTFGKPPPFVFSRTILAIAAAGTLSVIGALALYFRERRRQIVLVRASEEKYRGIFDDSITAIYVFDGDKKFVDSNSAGLQLLGYSREELLGMHVPDVDADPGEVLPVHQQLLDGTPIVNYEHRLKRKDGEIITVLNNSRPLTDPQGNVVGMQSTLIDITERKKAQAAIARAKEEWERTFDAVPDLVSIVNKHCQIVRVNKAMAQRLGLEPEEREGEHCYTCICPAKGPPAGCPHTDLLSDRQEHTIEQSMESLGGDFLVTMSPLFDSDGEFTGSVHVARDVTARNQAEEKLRLSEAKYRTLFDHAYAAILVFDLDDETILEANRQACEIYGFSHDEMIGKTLDLFQPPERHGRSKTLEILNQTPPHGLELVHYRKDRTQVFVEVRATIVEYGGREAVLTINRDITERKCAEEEHKKLEEQLRHSHKMKSIGQLAAGVAHEFNNLLVAILGNAEFLLTKVTDVQTPEFRQPLEDINTCGQRAASLTQRLLGFARKRTSHIKPVDLNAVVEGADRLIKQLLGERITLRTDLDPDLRSVEADVTEMEQAVMNLAINARDAMPEGGAITIRTQNVSFDEAYARANPDARGGPHAELVVEDDGCGMTAETIDRIFEPFFTTKPPGEGTGLGLSTVFADVTKLGGHLNVESTVGAGTRIRIYIPCGATTGSVPAATDDAPELGRLRGDETILVCDDAEAVLKSTSLLLQTAGYTVLTARGGREALQLSLSHAGAIDLLLTDVIMPKMNGPQLADALVQQRPGIKVLYMSGCPSDVFNAGVVQGERVEVLQKPSPSGVLVQSVREILDKPTRTKHTGEKTV